MLQEKLRRFSNPFKEQFRYNYVCGYSYRKKVQLKPFVLNNYIYYYYFD